MVQRSSTHIVRSNTLMEIGLKALYSEEAVASGVTTEKADLIFASLPYRIMPEFQIPLYDEMRERDRDFYDRLETCSGQTSCRAGSRPAHPRPWQSRTARSRNDFAPGPGARRGHRGRRVAAQRRQSNTSTLPAFGLRLTA